MFEVVGRTVLRRRRSLVGSGAPSGPRSGKGLSGGGGVSVTPGVVYPDTDGPSFRPSSFTQPDLTYRLHTGYLQVTHRLRTDHSPLTDHTQTTHRLRINHAQATHHSPPLYSYGRDSCGVFARGAWTVNWDV